MSDLFNRDGQLSRSALNQLGAVAQGARRHIAGSGNFYTGPLGATHLDASNQSSIGAFIQVLTAETEKIVLTDGSEGTAYPALQFTLAQGEWTPVLNGESYYVPSNGEPPPLDTLLSVALAATTVDGFPVFSKELPAAVVQVTGEVNQQTGQLEPVDVEDTDGNKFKAYPCLAGVLIEGEITPFAECYAISVVPNETPQLKGFYLGIVTGRARAVDEDSSDEQEESEDNPDEEDEGPLLPVYACLFGPAEQGGAFVQVDSSQRQAITVKSDTGETQIQGYKAYTCQLKGNRLTPLSQDPDSWYIGTSGQQPPNQTIIDVQPVGKDVDDKPIYASFLNSCILQITGPVDSEGNLELIAVDVLGGGQVGVYECNVGVIVGNGIDALIPAYAKPLDVNDQPGLFKYYLGVFAGRSVEEEGESQNIYGFRATPTAPDLPPPYPSPPPNLSGFPYPPYSVPLSPIINGVPMDLGPVLAGSPNPTPPPYFYGDIYPSLGPTLFGAAVPGWPRVLKPLPWPKQNALIWVLATNIYAFDNGLGKPVAEASYPLQTLLCDNTVGEKGFGRIVGHSMGNGVWVLDWQGFFLFSQNAGYFGPAPDLEVINSVNIGWGLSHDKVFSRLQLTATASLPNEDAQASDTSLSVSSWKAVDGLSVELQPGGAYLVVAQLSGVLQSVQVGDYIEVQLWEGTETVGCAAILCYAVCAGITVMGSAPLVWIFATGKDSITLQVVGKIRPGGSGNPSASILGCSDDGGSTITAVRIAEVSSLG